MDDIFSTVKSLHSPLSDRMRPKTIAEFIGQTHLVSEKSLLLRAIKADRLGSCIFFGPPGTGKTTLAHIIADQTGNRSVKLNAVSSGVAEAKEVIKEAQTFLKMYDKKTYLILDECHRWSKTQSDSVLSAIEKGEIVFIGTTTENPYVNMTKAIISRCRVFEFAKLQDDEIVFGLNKAIKDKERGLGEYNISIEEGALEHIAWASNGDLRTALNALEIAVLTTDPDDKQRIMITKEVAASASGVNLLSIDTGSYYDIISAFCKSLRGSDADAALYYAFSLLNAGVDPLIVFRRLIVHSSEDVGMADPNALVVATNAMLAFEKIGMPEGRIPLSHAIIYVATAPKSNSVIKAVNLAENSSKANINVSVPIPLRDPSYSHIKIDGYLYPHNYPGGWVKQQYLPDEIKNEIYYIPSKYGYEKNIKILKKGDE